VLQSVTRDALDPFTVGLVANDYNSTATRALLDLAYAPHALTEALTLSVRACALESVRILLTHPSLAGYSILHSERYVERVKSLALDAAAELGFIEAMKLLLADKRLNATGGLSSIIQRALNAAVKADRPES